MTETPLGSPTAMASLPKIVWLLGSVGEPWWSADFGHGVGVDCGGAARFSDFLLAWRGGFGADVDALSEAGWGGLAFGHGHGNEEKREGAGRHDGGGTAAASGLG